MMMRGNKGLVQACDHTRASLLDPYIVDPEKLSKVENRAFDKVWPFSAKIKPI